LGTDRPLLADGDINEQADWLNQESSCVHAEECQQVIYVIFVFIGAIVNLKSILDFGDMMILAMAFPNLLGCYLLSGKVATALDDYLTRLNTGIMMTYEASQAQKREMQPK
jgi:Na+/alanine symporter